MKMAQVRIRGLKRLRNEAQTAASFANALKITNYTSPELVIEWDGLDQLAAVDVDWHDEYKPTGLLSDILRLPVQPRWSWITHGQGVRLIYEAQGALTAEEIAVLSSMTFGNLFGGRTGVEIKAETR